MARLNYVPQHSIIVVRDDKQVDALAEYERTGKAFKFTQDEIDDITRAHDGNLDAALRAPTDESDVKTEDKDPTPAASNTNSAGGNKPAPTKDTDL